MLEKQEKEPFYITTTLPYVNAAPHVGHASEFVLADVRARWERQQGKDVIFNTGTDEHGIKIWQKAQELGRDTQDYVDEYAIHFKDLKELLNLSYTHFIRTTDAHHKEAARELWRRVNANGFIYKKYYQIKYCIGCELEKTDSELENDECPFHPGKELEIIEEENYFFQFSAFQKRLQALYEKYPDFVVPNKRFNEIKSLVDGGLKDFSISRLRKKMSWGVSVPGDDDHVMYVWFDALTDYISTLRWPQEDADFQKYWGSVEAPRALQIAGKDNLRQQSAMWQAMLMSAGLPTSRQIFINGFIGVDGQKMSKSLGNVIAPSEMVARYGVDGTRYILLTKSNFGEDSDIAWEKMDAVYNADLANGLGNLVSRVVTLAGDIPTPKSSIEEVQDEMISLMQRMEFRGALEKIWMIVCSANKYIEDTQPWKLRKSDEEEFVKVMTKLLSDIGLLSSILTPFLPETAHKIERAIETRERIILFARIEAN